MENVISATDSYFKYAIGKSALHGKEFHEHDEIVYYIGGGVKFISKNIQMTLPSGSIVFIPRETFHQFVFLNEEKYCRCILHYSGNGSIKELIKSISPEAKVITAPSSNMIKTFDFLTEMAKHELSDEDKQMLLNSAFAELLIEQKIIGAESVTRNNTASKLSQDVLDYLDNNYASNIKISNIAKMMNVSESTLSHTFKRELSISIYKYVTEKRLSAARALVTSGTSLCNAALLSGFSDYSSFFRLYKKKHGENPCKKTRAKKG